MTPEFQKIMFEPFSRADDHRTTKVQGTGLGMAIARNIVNLMNGDIQVESAPNKGTKITVTVYLKLQENEKEQEKELLDLPVLVVDDDKTCCESTVATLQEIGIAGEWVLTGKEAVERCAAQDRPRLFCGDPGLEDAGNGRYRNCQKNPLTGMRRCHDHHPYFL